VRKEVISTKTHIIGIKEIKCVINKMLNCLINNFLGGSIPMGINCAPLFVYLFPYRFRYATDFVFNKTSYSNHLLLIYTQVY